MSLDKLKQELLPLIKTCAKFGNFTLASGKKSDFYFDGRLVTCSAKGSYLIAKIILELIKGLEVKAIGGLTLGADPIASAVACLSYQEGLLIDAFIVRKEAKGHGTGQQVEGIYKNGDRIVIVDDVVTTASSTLKAINTMEKLGCKVVKVICLLDRLEGGKDALKNYDFEPIFTKTNLIK